MEVAITLSVVNTAIDESGRPFSRTFVGASPMPPLRSCLHLAQMSVVVVAFSVCGCGKDGTSQDIDVTPPNTVNDLRAVSPTPTSIQLTWTSPGDDSIFGTATAYDVRWSRSSFPYSAWDTLSGRIEVPSAVEAGYQDYLLAAGFARGRDYFFALKARDEAMNWSGLSNIGGCVTTSYSRTGAWGSRGHEDSLFGVPRGLAAGPSGCPADGASGVIYVTDTAEDRVQKFLPDGTFLDVWGGFDDPDGIAVDAHGDVYVVETANDRVLKLTCEGDTILWWGSHGSGPGEFYSPHGIALDPSGRVYVADTNNHRIQRFNEEGGFQCQWGSYGSGQGQFAYPLGVAADGAGNVYVADTGNHRVQKFSACGVTFLAMRGEQGWRDGEFDYPRRLAITDRGTLLVVDTNNNRIQEFTPESVFASAWGGYGAGEGEFDQPNDIAVDASGDVYVVDSFNRRVQRFTLTRQ